MEPSTILFVTLTEDMLNFAVPYETGIFQLIRRTTETSGTLPRLKQSTRKWLLDQEYGSPKKWHLPNEGMGFCDYRFEAVLLLGLNLRGGL